ncbi:MAG: MFS transporter [Gemmobacter sp.]
MPLKAWGTGAGPVIAALGVTQIVGYGALYYAYAVLAPFVAADLDVSQAALFAALSAGLLLGALTAPVFGRKLDRHGAAAVMAAGSAAVSVLLVLLAIAPGFGTFAALIVLIEVIGFTVLYDAAFAVLARHAPANPRAAITRLTLIAGFASTLFWPLTGWLAEVAGWRATYAIFAALTLGLALPLHLWIARRPVPAPTTAPQAETDRQARFRVSGTLAQRAFWQVGIGFALSGMALVAMGVHMVPILLARGLGDAAYAVGMAMGPAQVLIRIVDATLWRRLHPVTVALIASGAVPLAMACLLLPASPTVLGLMFAVLLGTGGGLSSIVRGSVPVSLFGVDGLGERLGRLAALRSLLGASAPFLFAAATAAIGMDRTLWLTIGIAAAGFAVIGWLWRDLRRDARLSTPAAAAAPPTSRAWP